MKIFGVEIRRVEKQQLSPVYANNHGWTRILEPFAGAFQRNIEEKRESVICYPALYACLSRISQDVGKLPFLLKREDDNGIWRTVQNPAYSPVLAKPNHYQTAQQFRESWALSKLQHGNTYVLKGRDNRGVVTRLYVLDPCRVLPMISDTGDVFYQLSYSTAENLLPQDYPAENIIVPAREIIHDRMNTFHHQLIGVPPLCAAYWPAVKNLKILKSSSDFFGNRAQPSGILTGPAGMSKEDGEAVSSFWNENFTGPNAGRIGFLGADMKFIPISSSGADSQLVEQMQYSDKQICQPFGIPPYIVGVGEIPAGLKVDDVTNTYYSLALQAHIEAMENLLDEGLGIARPLGVELDLEPLLRMDASKKAAFHKELVGSSIETPNEARQQFGMNPLEGGDTVYMQQQNYSLQALARRDAQEDPFGTAAAPEPEPDPELEAANEEVRQLTAELWQRKALEATREAIHA